MARWHLWRPNSLEDIAALRAAEISREIGAGISVAAVAVPIGLAYASLTGVPPQIGLYASIVPTMVYALLGPSSRFLIVGPDTSICLLLGVTITQLGVSAPDDRAAVAAGLTMLVGLGCIVAGLARLGSLANLISRPVLVGYLAGVAITLLIAQLPSLTGVALSAPGIIRPFIELARRAGEISQLTLMLGIGFFILLRAMRRLTPRIPGPAAVLVLGIALSYLLDLPARGVATVGAIPSGLPVPVVPALTGEPSTLALSVLGLLIVSFSSGILTARSFAARTGARVDPNRELLGFGAADMAAGLFQGFAGTGADSRTAVALSSGGRTALVGLVAGATIALVLSLLTGPLALLPQAALGAILVSAALGLFDLQAFVRLDRIDRHELVFALIAAAGVIWIGVLQGVFIAVAVTLLHLLHRAAHPREGLMGHVPEGGHFVTLHHHPEARLPQGGVVYLFQASVLFLNAEFFGQRVLQTLDETPGAKWLVLDASAMVHVDSSAVEVFERVKVELDRRDVALFIGGARGQFLRVLQRAGLLQQIGADRLFPNTDLAVQAAIRSANGAA